jgi:hypothetical protein
MTVMAALLPLALALAMTMIGCPIPDDDGGVVDGNPGGDLEPVGIQGKWVNQGTSTFVVLEFTATQLIISGTEPTTIYFTSETDGEIKTGTSAGSITEVFCDSYDITAGVLTFTGGKSADDYPSTNFYRVNALTNNQWKDGVITGDSQGQVWYSFNIANGTTYRMWWNDGYGSTGGNGLKTLDISVSGYYSSGTSAFTEGDLGWTTNAAKSFTPNASQSGTVYIKVTPYDTGKIGTFGIIYSTTATTRPNAPFNPPITPLTAGVWADGEITAASNGAVWYSFNVSTLTAYNVWWNESSPNGNGIKTLNVDVRGFYSDGSAVLGFTTTATAWSSAKTFTPTANGTVYLKVTPYTSGQTGTFGIVYNTGLLAERPNVAFNPSATPLTADTWTDGEITSSVREVWYSLTVTSGTPYYFWWNEGDTGNGNRTKTLDIRVSAFDSTGTVISDFNAIDAAWTTVTTFTPTTAQAGTVYIRVTPYYSTTNNTGTYGIIYSATATTRPPVPIAVNNPTALTADVWTTGNIATTDSEVWYSFEVTSGTTYRVWWDDNGSSSSGSDLFKTLDVSVSAWYGSTGNVIFYNQDYAWSSAQSFNPPSTETGTVYVKVYPKTAGAAGTFGIVYSNTTSTRPIVPFGPGEPPNPIPLTVDTWADGEITAAGGEVWYSINVTSGTTYRVWWNEGGNYGNGSKTLDVYVNAWYGDGTSIYFTNDGGYAWTDSQAPSFTPNASNPNTVYIRVRAYGRTNTGTFGIVYSAGTTKPAVPFTPPATPTPLTADVWKDGELTTFGTDTWYSFNVASGTTYRMWWNEYDTFGNGLKTANIIVSAWYANGNICFENVTTAWDTAQSFSPSATQAGTVYVRVTLDTNTYTRSAGTYGILYSPTATATPVVPFTPPVNHTALTVDQWKDGVTTASSDEVWYSFTVNNGTTYRMWWNEYGTYGNGLKTANIRVSAWHDNGVYLIKDEDYGWGTAVSFASPANGTVYVRVTLNTSYSSPTGTYGIIYSTSTTRPVVPITPVSPTALTADQWRDGNITTTGGEAWYSFTVNAGNYYVWWNDYNYGDSTKTMNVKVSAYYSDGTVIFTDRTSRWSSSENITVTSNNTVYLRVAAYATNRATGTFAVVFSTTNTRPFNPPNPTTMTADTWASGTIFTSDGVQWFKFTATSSTQYIHFIFGTLSDFWVQVYNNIGDTVGAKTNIYNSNSGPINRSVTPNQDYYISVSPYGSGTGGTGGSFQIAFNTSSPPPAAP